MCCVGNTVLHNVCEEWSVFLEYYESYPMCKRAKAGYAVEFFT